jgi:IclR family acetate operon transcriptional repressor
MRRNGEREVERRNPVEKAVQMLAWMADSGEGHWGIRQLARGLEIPPSTAHRTVSMLEAAGVLTSDGEARYRFSLDFIRLASRVALDVPLRRAAMPHLRRLVERINETAYLGVYSSDRKRMMYVDCVHSTHPLRYVLPLYEWLPMHAGAGGEGILAFLPEDEIEAILASAELEPVTEQTVTDADELRRELIEVRARGYVMSVGRLIAGAVGIAAPVFGPDNRVIGDIVLALPEARIEPLTADTLGRELATCGDAVSADLGGNPAAARGTRGIGALAG